MFRMLRRAAALLTVSVTAVAAVATPARAQEPTGLTGAVYAWDTSQVPADACVTVFRADVQESVASGCVDADGQFAIAVEPGEYKLQAVASGLPTQWYAQRSSWERAQPVQVTESGAWVTFYLYAGFGDITGTILDTDGTPVDGADVTATSVESGSQTSAVTDTAGRYTIMDLRPGQYTVLIYKHPKGSQYAYGTKSPDEATVFDVAAGEVVEVNDTLLGPGTVRVTIVDSGTGRRITRGCVTVHHNEGGTVCESSRGVFTVTDVPAGSYEIDVHPEGTHWPTTAAVEVTPGTTSSVTVPVERATALVTTVREAGTGRPAAGVCGSLVRAGSHGVGPVYNGEGCSDADGRLVLGPLTGSVRAQLYLWDDTERYGAQWVGESGGTGDQRRAVWFIGRDGLATTIRSPRVDPPGSITGVVRSQETGAALRHVCAFPYSLASTTGLDRQRGSHCTDAQGAYTVTGLGPYAWPVVHVAVFQNEYPWLWSGGEPDRFAARYVPVRAGQATTADLEMPPTATIEGRALLGTGEPTMSYMTAYSARTGDLAGPPTSSNPWAGGGYELRQLAPGQRVTISYFVQDTGHDCWYDGVADRAAASPVTLASGGAMTGIDLRDCAAEPAAVAR